MSQNEQTEVVETTIIDVEPETVQAAETRPSVFQSYNWWLDTVQNENWAYLNEAFSDYEVKSAIEIGESAETAAAEDSDIVDGVQTRSWIRSDVESNKWLFQKLAGIVGRLNEQFFNYDVDYIDSIQFVNVTGESDLSGAYTDLQYMSASTKKLTFVVELSEGTDYLGGATELHLGEKPTVLPSKIGTVFMFPSFVLRNFNPVSEGTKKMLIGTVVGPRFK